MTGMTEDPTLAADTYAVAKDRATGRTIANLYLGMLEAGMDPATALEVLRMWIWSAVNKDTSS
jgi:hypothetical protein